MAVFRMISTAVWPKPTELDRRGECVNTGYVYRISIMLLSYYKSYKAEFKCSLCVCCFGFFLLLAFVPIDNYRIWFLFVASSLCSACCLSVCVSVWCWNKSNIERRTDIKGKPAERFDFYQWKRRVFDIFFACVWNCICRNPNRNIGY